MRRTRHRAHGSTTTRRALVATAALSACLLATACGNADGGSAHGDGSGSSPSPSPSADTSLGQGTWLLGVSTAAGADAEASKATYLTYDPATGQTSAHTLPKVTTPSADSDDAALLVSTDREWAIPDTGIPQNEEDSGRLTFYSLRTGKPRTLDIRQATGDSALRALGWAFDPRQPATVRVVDSKNRVWTVPVTGGRARRSGQVARGAWVFANGFNHNTGEPYVESIDSDQTMPAGNGETDHTAVQRAGGVVIASGSAALAKLPKSPCRVASAFTTGQGTTWTFCADGRTIRAYVLAPGSSTWTAYGKPSAAVVPDVASFPLALPPQG